MTDRKNIFEYALRHTKILKMPQQNLSTFGTTNIDYYALSRVKENTRIRQGKVISSRPRIRENLSIGSIAEESFLCFKSRFISGGICP